MVWLQRENVESMWQENPESGARRTEERMTEIILEKMREFSVSRRHDKVSIESVDHNREQEMTSVGLWRRLSCIKTTSSRAAQPSFGDCSNPCEMYSTTYSTSTVSK